MFNGITEAIGRIAHAEIAGDCLHVTIAPNLKFSDLTIGDSVAVNGVCLTVTRLGTENFSATIVPETLRLTNLGNLNNGSEVNLERSMRMNARISGHYVQGHVDGIGEVIDLQQDGEKALIVKIRIAESLSHYIVKKGYVAIDGMSITVIDVAKDYFTVTFIPHTREVTIAKHYVVGTKVNIEVDMLAKYVEKFVGSKVI